MAIKGNSEILYIWDEVDTYEPIVCLTSNSLSETVSVIESVTKCDPGETVRAAGTHSYEIGFEGEYAAPEADKASWSELATKLRSLATFTWRITTTYPDATTDVSYGTGIFTDLEKTSAAGDEFITFSGSLSGSGAITAVDPTV